MKKEYYFKAASKEGEIFSGILEASSYQGALSQILRAKLMVITLEEDRDIPLIKQIAIFFRLGYAKESDLIAFLDQCVQLLKAGVTIHDIFSLSAQTAKKSSFKNALEDIHQQLSSGHSLVSSMKRHPEIFPSIVLTMVSIGEKTGDLQNAFEKASILIQFDFKLKNKLSDCFRYPIFLAIAIIAAILLASIFILPDLDTFFRTQEAELPLLTQYVMGFGQFLKNDYKKIIIGLFLFFGIFFYWSQSQTGQYEWSKIKLEFPLLGPFNHKIAVSRFCRSLSLLLEAKVSIHQAFVALLQSMSNTYMMAKVIQMCHGLEKGESLPQVAEKSEVFPDLVLQMLAIGDRTGELEKMLEKVALQFEFELDNDIKKLSFYFQQFSILILAIFVLMFALAIMLPVWDLAGVVVK